MTNPFVEHVPGVIDLHQRIELDQKASMAASPFPGMDPYLEAPDIWPDVHSTLIAIFREQLTPQLVPKYLTDLQAQIVIEKIVDDQFVRHTRQPAAGGVMIAERIEPAPMRARVPLTFPTRLLTLYIRTSQREKPVAAIELLSPANKRPGEERRKYLEKRMAYVLDGRPARLSQMRCTISVYIASAC